MLNVLVTGAGSVIGQAIIKSLRASSLEVNIIAADYFPMAVGLYWCKSHYLLPDILKVGIAHDVGHAGVDTPGNIKFAVDKLLAE